MSVSSNPATGEIEVELGGTVFRLRASMRNVGALEKQLDVSGLKGVEERLLSGNIDVIVMALKCLCVSDNADAIDDVHYSQLPIAVDAVWKTMTSGLPDTSKKKTVSKPATATKNGPQHPGRDSALLPLAS